MTTLQCSYCSLNINDDDYLHCGECGGDVHVKCLRRSRPGDLMGDVFFDFTCAKCMQLHYEGPSTSSEVINGTHEKYVRQRMPWLMVITLTLYNLSIKSKGLSRHGYFHWRTHIVNFIDKNWDYLFDPTMWVDFQPIFKAINNNLFWFFSKRRKKWTGSISGALSHNRWASWIKKFVWNCIYFLFKVPSILLLAKHFLKKQDGGNSPLTTKPQNTFSVYVSEKIN